MTMDIDTLFDAAIAGDTDAKKQLAMIADHVSGEFDRTILHIACEDGNRERVKFIVTEFANKNLLVKLDKRKQTPLHLAADNGLTEVVEILIDAARRMGPSSATTDDPYNSPFRVEDFLRRANHTGDTALHQAADNGDWNTVERLAKADPEDRHVQNMRGYTPMYIAVEAARYDIVKLICEACKAPSLDGPEGTTALHLVIGRYKQEYISLDTDNCLIFNSIASGSAHNDIVMALMDSAKGSSLSKNESGNYFKDLFDRTDHQNQTLLSLAVLKNNLDVVKLILKEDPAYEHPTTSKYSDLKSLISTASRKGYKDIVKILLKIYGKHGRQRCHVLLTEAIEEGHKELAYSLLEYDKHLAGVTGPVNPGTSSWSDQDTRNWTALHYAVFHKFDQIIEAIISAQIYIGYGLKNEGSPLILAVEKGYISTAVLLMNLLPATSSFYYVVRDQNILHIAVEQSNKDMIQTILAYCPTSLIYKIVNGQDKDGNTPLHLLSAKGFFVPELIKHNSVDIMARNKQDQTPSDMLYSHEKIKDDQAKIKYLLDDASTTQQFRRINIKGIWSNRKGPGHTTKRLLKDLEFKVHMKDIVKEELQEWKEKIRPYRERTTTQIIVTALITTVTFTVGFTMPGGYHQSGEPEEGLVLLSKKKDFLEDMRDLPDLWN